MAICVPKQLAVSGHIPEQLVVPCHITKQLVIAFIAHFHLPFRLNPGFTFALIVLHVALNWLRRLPIFFFGSSSFHPRAFNLGSLLLHPCSWPHCRCGVSQKIFTPMSNEVVVLHYAQGSVKQKEALHCTYTCVRMHRYTLVLDKKKKIEYKWRKNICFGLL